MGEKRHADNILVGKYERKTMTRKVQTSVRG
jgi:hypothetical protein